MAEEDKTLLTSETPPAETPPAETPPAETPPAETPPAETPPAETPPADEVPETYADFTMPEGVEVDKALLEQATPVFKELGLTQEQAQKLVDLQAQNAQQQQTAQYEAFEKTKSDWLTESRNDAEIGGERFEETVSDAKLFLDKFGNDALRSLLNDYGIGNHVEVIRAFSHAGKLIKEDVPGGGGDVATTPRNKTESRINNLYGSQDKS